MMVFQRQRHGGMGDAQLGGDVSLGNPAGLHGRQIRRVATAWQE
jgi:hypothetical protein